MDAVPRRTVLDAVNAVVAYRPPWAEPLALDCSPIHPSLPDGELPLTELRQLLLRQQAPFEVRNAVWAELVFLAQQRGGDWELGAVWMMAPGLRRAAWRVVGSSRVPYADMESEVVEGFVRELRIVDVEAPSIPARLWWAGYRQGLRARDSYRPPVWNSEVPDPSLLRPYTSPPGHPDLVLERAVRSGAISGDEAELIGSKRLEEEGLARAATQLDLGLHACRARRSDAEERLARFLVVSGPRNATQPRPWAQEQAVPDKEAA